MIGRVYGLGEDFHQMNGVSMGGGMMENYDMDMNGFFAAANGMYFQQHQQNFNQYGQMNPIQNQNYYMGNQQPQGNGYYGNYFQGMQQPQANLNLTDYLHSNGM